MIDEEVLKIVLGSITFSQRQAASVVGGRRRLVRLIENGKIRVEKNSTRQNGRWDCNAWDCAKNAQLTPRIHHLITKNQKP